MQIYSWISTSVSAFDVDTDMEFSIWVDTNTYMDRDFENIVDMDKDICICILMDSFLDTNIHLKSQIRDMDISHMDGIFGYNPHI